MIRVELPIRVVSVANLREHWAMKAARAKLQRNAAKIMLRPFAIPALPVTVTMTRIGAGTLDDDNLSNGCKHARDGVADWLGTDDANPGISWKYAQLKSKRGSYGLVVEVTA